MQYTENIKGYIFATEQEAKTAIQSINVATGIPVSQESVTTSYCEFESKDNKIFIRWNETIESVLGASSNFSINIEI